MSDISVFFLNPRYTSIALTSPKGQNTVIYHTNRAWIELSSDAFFYNITQLKRIVGAAQIAAVLKANAYGHGLVEMGLLCDQTTQVSFICVAFLSEALILRNAGVAKSIIVLSYTDADLSECIGKNIAFVVDEHEQVLELHTIAQRYNTTFDIHIKVDTGLTRRGLEVTNIVSFVGLINQLSHIRIVGICSHFVSAYNLDTSFTAHQIHLFSLLLYELELMGIYIPFIHISNSSCMSAGKCNVYRIGISVYGYTPKSLGIPFRPVLSFKTRIVQIKEVPANVHVGYDRTYCTTRQTKLGLLPIGYFDGYDVRFSNTGTMYINGFYAPVRGRVAMNMTAIDITEIPNISVGDSVLVLGDRDGVRAFDLGKQAGIANIRDLLTGLNPLLPRIIT